MDQASHLQGRMQWAAFASIGAGVIHGAAIGLHADHLLLSRLFLAFTVAQVCWGVVALTRSSRLVALSGIAINGAAVLGWVLAKTTGISMVGGLEIAEKPQPADTLCALLAGLSVLAVCWAWSRRNTPFGTTARLNAVLSCGGLALLALWGITGHAHSDTHEVLALTPSQLTINADGVIVSPSTAPSATDTSITDSATSTTTTAPRKKTRQSANAVALPSSTTPVNTTTTTVHGHAVTRDQALAAASGWPKPYDPAIPMDFTGIGGVTAEQAARATKLIQSTITDMAKFANVDAAIADGYVSIGDGATGFEHYINYSLLLDDRVLDTTAPESLVYATAGGTKKLVSVMFIANPGTSLTDATLANYAGGLMQWHVHSNLCWSNVDGVPKVVGVVDANGVCQRGVLQSGGAPMVHVWVTPHLCGPFAALEGTGAGVADVSDAERVDMCSKEH